MSAANTGNENTEQLVVFLSFFLFVFVHVGRCSCVFFMFDCGFAVSVRKSMYISIQGLKQKDQTISDNESLNCGTLCSESAQYMFHFKKNKKDTFFFLKII